MIILNTTFIVESSLENAFVEWARSVYVPAMAAVEIFGPATVAKVLTQIEPGATSFAVQATASGLEEARRWHDETAALLRDDLAARYGERVLHFTTYMEVID